MPVELEGYVWKSLRFGSSNFHTPGEWKILGRQSSHVITYFFYSLWTGLELELERPKSFPLRSRNAEPPTNQRNYQFWRNWTPYFVTQTSQFFCTSQAQSLVLGIAHWRWFLYRNQWILQSQIFQDAGRLHGLLCYVWWRLSDPEVKEGWKMKVIHTS